MIAAEEGRLKCVRMLLEAEARMQDEEGHNALMRAASKGHGDIARVLVSEEAGLQNNMKETTMMLSVESEEIASLLPPFEAGFADRSGLNQTCCVIGNNYCNGYDVN